MKQRNALLLESPIEELNIFSNRLLIARVFMPSRVLQHPDSEIYFNAKRTESSGAAQKLKHACN
jgi:hypothetical protein